MSDAIDAQGRWILSYDEVCRHCGTAAKRGHPGGVVPSRWTCYTCGRSQMEGTSTGNPETVVNDAREAEA